MAENKVMFYRGAYGKVENWASALENKNGIYFNTDTKTIAMNGVEYGFNTEILDKVVRGLNVENGVLSFEVFDKTTDAWSEDSFTLIKVVDKSITLAEGEDGVAEIKVNVADVAEGEDGLKLGLDGLFVDLTKTKAAIANLQSIEYEGKEAIEINDKKISLKLVKPNNILSQTDDGLTATLRLNYDSESKQIQLLGIGDKVIDHVPTNDFVVDGFLESVKYSEEEGEEKTLVFTWNTSAGIQATKIDLSEYIDTYNAGVGLVLNSKTFSVKVDDTTEKFLTVGAGGVKLSGVAEMVDKKIEDAALVWNEAITDEVE